VEDVMDLIIYVIELMMGFIGVVFFVVVVC